MAKMHLIETLSYRGHEIDLIQYADGKREFGIVTDRVTVNTEGYFAFYRNRSEAEAHIDRWVDAPPTEGLLDQTLRDLGIL